MTIPMEDVRTTRIELCWGGEWLPFPDAAGWQAAVWTPPDTGRRYFGLLLHGNQTVMTYDISRQATIDLMLSTPEIFIFYTGASADGVRWIWTTMQELTRVFRVLGILPGPEATNQATNNEGSNDA